MKKVIVSIILLIVVIVTCIMIIMYKKNNTEISNNMELSNNYIIPNNEIINNIVTDNRIEEKMNIPHIKINNQIFNVVLEDNSATRALLERLKKEDILINAHEYGGFEKVGDLGFSLPREDSEIQTLPGDIVLYQGNQISIFYNSNNWSYTKLGRIQDVDANELKNVLGNGDVTIIFTVSQ